MPDRYDAVVVGAGPNGLAAAIEIARAGRSVLVVERDSTLGGGSRSAELTEPGFIHDVCSAIHPTAIGSPFFRTLPLTEHGLEWIHPNAPVAHPLDDGTAVVIERSLEATAAALGPDADAYRRLLEPIVEDIEPLLQDILGSMRPPRHPIRMGILAARLLRPLTHAMRARFSEDRAPAAIAGLAGHSMLRLDRWIGAPATLAGVVFVAIAHSYGFPMARGGSQAIADALASYLRSLGGRIELETDVTRLSQLPESAAVLFDVTPRQLVAICGDALPRKYRRRLGRFRYGPGVCKVDWALDGPVPWKAEECHRAGTLHLGGTIDEIAAAERDVHEGRHPDPPFIVMAQQSPFDHSRAPAGKHTLWAYCHVPHGSDIDMSDEMERQIERFAPGFRDRVIARHVRTAAQMEAYNPNYVGGDINGGIQDLMQHVFRPVPRIDPYATPNPRIFLCSSSTPPVGGVHGMCGYFAARSALRRALR